MEDLNLYPDWETDSLHLSEPQRTAHKLYRREVLNDLQEVDREIAAIRRLRIERNGKQAR